jgi:hypothetical protein
MRGGRGRDEPSVGAGSPFVETSQGGLFFANAVMAAPALLVLWPVLIRALLIGVGALEGPSPLLDPVPAVARQVGPYVAWLSVIPLWTCRRNLGMTLPLPARWVLRAFVALHVGVLGWWLLAVANW